MPRTLGLIILRTSALLFPSPWDKRKLSAEDFSLMYRLGIIRHAQLDYPTTDTSDRPGIPIAECKFFEDALYASSSGWQSTWSSAAVPNMELHRHHDTAPTGYDHLPTTILAFIHDGRASSTTTSPFPPAASSHNPRPKG